MEQLHPEAEDQRRAPETTDFDGLDAHDFDAGTYGDDWRAYPDATEHVAPARSGFARTSLWIGLPGLLIVGAVGAFWTLGPWPSRQAAAPAPPAFTVSLAGPKPAPDGFAVAPAAQPQAPSDAVAPAPVAADPAPAASQAAAPPEALKPAPVTPPPSAALAPVLALAPVAKVAPADTPSEPPAQVEPPAPAAQSVATATPSEPPAPSTATVPAQVEPPAAQGAATAPSPPSASAPAAAPAPAMDPATADKFIARASDMIAQGDIAGARLMLGPAAEGGSAKAMFALAQTYDPATLAQWKVIGLQGDKAKAIAWYDRALKAGDSAAAGALAKLR